MTFEELVRKRPVMIIGNDGIPGLLNGLIIDFINFCDLEKTFIEIIISGENDFILGITTQQNLSKFWQCFMDEKNEFGFHLPKVLKIVSSKFEIITISQIKSEIRFSFDQTIFPLTDIDYFKLTDKISQVALLNRRSEILIIDKRQKYINQNYFHFPQGIFYLFDRAITDVLGKPEFKLTFDNKFKNNLYQIGIAYRTDWFPRPNIISFANDIRTTNNGSLVEGIIDGLVEACERHSKNNNLTSFEVNRKKFINGLILICAVRGQDFKYGGSFKESLEDNNIREDVKNLVSELVLEFIKTQKEKADKFLWRFDSTQLTSGMY